VAAHQRHPSLPQSLGEIAALLDIRDQQVGIVTKFLADIPHRYAAADRIRHVEHRLDRHVGDAER